eukprot:gene23206-1347_t
MNLKSSTSVQQGAGTGPPVSPTPATDHIAVLQHIMSTLSTSATLLVAGAAAGAGLAVAYMNHRQQNPQLPHQLQVSPTPETDHIAVLLLTCGKDETEGLVAALGASLVSTDVSKSSNLHIFGMLANIQSVVDDNPEEEATGQRAEGLLRKGGTYVALQCNPIDPSEVVTSFKGRPGKQEHGQ